MDNQSITNDQKLKPDNLLAWSILSTVLCCVPLGIVAIIFSNKVDTLWAQGDYAGAEDAAKKAKLFCFIALGVGLVFDFICFILGLFSSLY